MSAAKTGTPMPLKASASTCSVTVLPVPVAPATRPWRLAICGSRRMSNGPAAAVPFPMSRPSAASATVCSFPPSAIACAIE